jgi:hypothetical protein
MIVTVAVAITAAAAAVAQCSSGAAAKCSAVVVGVDVLSVHCYTADHLFKNNVHA